MSDSIAATSKEQGAFKEHSFREVIVIVMSCLL